MKHARRWLTFKTFCIAFALSLAATSCGNDVETPGALEQPAASSEVGAPTTQQPAPATEEQASGSDEEATGEDEAASAADLRPIGFVNASTSYLSLLQVFVAQQEGFFEERGLEVEIVNTPGAQNAIAALESGDAQVALGFAEVAAQARAAGSGIVVIGTTIQENLYELYSQPGIDDPADLAGGSVAMFIEGNATHTVAQWLLDEHGAGAEQTTFVAAGGQPDRLASVVEGQVDAAVLSSPFDILAEQEGLVSLASMTDYVEGYPFQPLKTTESTLEEYRAEITAFMEALNDATMFIEENPDQAFAVGQIVQGGDEEVNRQSFDFLREYYPADVSVVSLEGLQWALDVLTRYTPAEGIPTAEELYVDVLE